MTIEQTVKHIFLHIVFLCFFLPAKGQNRYTHDRLENLKSGSVDYIFSEHKMEPTPDGGFVIANKEPGTTDIFVVKFDSCGQVSWSKRLEKMANFTSCSGMLTDPVGNVALLFQRYHLSEADTAYLVKMDAGGSLAWAKKIAFPGYLGKADFALAPNGSYCFGSNYTDESFKTHDLIVFVDAATGGVKFSASHFSAGTAGIHKFASLPDGNLLVRKLNEMFSINPNTLEIAWAKQYQSLSASGDTKPLVLSGRIVDLARAANAANFVPHFYDLSGNFLYKTARIAGSQDAFRPSRYGPRQLTKLPGERIAFATTDSAGGFRTTLVVLDSLGKLLLTKHFHPTGSTAKRAANDQCLLKDGTIAIVGEENGRVEVLKISPENTLLDCTFDTGPELATPEFSPFLTKTDPIFQQTQLQFSAVDFFLTAHDFDLKIDEKCSSVETITDHDSTLFLCPRDSAIVAVNHSLPTSCVWDDGFLGCERAIKTGETLTATATVRCTNFTQKFTAIEKQDCPCFLKIPDAFTPNGDMVNDDFRPVGDCRFLEFDMQVFGRWGQAVFSSTDAKNGWDGTIDGRPAPSDLYVFLLKYRTTLPGAGPVSEKGEVTLLR